MYELLFFWFCMNFSSGITQSYDFEPKKKKKENHILLVHWLMLPPLAKLYPDFVGTPTNNFGM